jgi:Fe-S cluster biogenesis protein NfuA
MKINNEILHSKIEVLLDQVRPHFISDGGNIEVVEITDDNVVKIRFIGSCSECERAPVSFNYTIKEMLINEIPEIKDVIQLQ